MNSIASSFASARLVSSALVLASVAVFTGCQSHPVRAPFGAHQDVGRLAVVTFSNAPKVSFQVPGGRGEIWREPVALEFGPPSGDALRAVVAYTAPHGPQAIAVGTVAVGLSPLVLAGTAVAAHEVRRFYGAVVADSDGAVARARAALAQASPAGDFERRLGASVLAHARRARPATRPLALARPVLPLSASRKGQVSPGHVTEADYSGLAARGIDTVLEIKIHEPRLSGADRINPALALSFHARVRIVSARDGRELYYDYLEYRGEGRTFVAWAEHDARAFRAEIDRAVASLASEIVAQALERERDVLVSSRQLADVGLVRRTEGQGWSSAPLPVAVSRARTFAGR